MNAEHAKILNSVLTAIRCANGTVSALQRNEFVMQPHDAAKDYAEMRIELSVAASQLSQLLDDAGALQAITCVACNTALTPDTAIRGAWTATYLCRACEASARHCISGGVS